MRNVSDYKGNKISLNELQEYLRITDYPELADAVLKLVNNNSIKPVKSRGINGKKPSLYVAYHILRDKDDDTELIQELKYLSPQLSPEYYRKNIEQYKRHRVHILRLNDFLMNHAPALNVRVSVNERSFEIFGREKYILREGGLHILKNLGISLESLNVYETTEPLAYYCRCRHTPQNVLLIENKDTFYTLRRYLIQEEGEVFGKPVGTVIYGGGKAIYRSIYDLDLCAEPYINDSQNMFLYLGDIDYEGFLIYEKLHELSKGKHDIMPFVEGYAVMLAKAEKMRERGLELPDMKEGQNKNCGDTFFSHFSDEAVGRMRKILESGRYIPQEILQISDFASK